MPSRDTNKLSELAIPRLSIKGSPNQAIGSIINVYMSLPGLVAFWPMTSVDENARAIDISGMGTHLSRAFIGGLNQVYYTQHLAAGWNFVASSNSSFDESDVNWLRRADEPRLSITGLEGGTQFHKGLTMGCWMNWTSTLLGRQRTIMGKWNSTGNQRSYLLQLDTSTRPVFMISNTGADNHQIVSSVPIMEAFTFVVGRYNLLGADEISVFVSQGVDSTNAKPATLIKTTNSTAIPASIFDSTADFTIGASHGGVDPSISWYFTLAFICAAALPDSTIRYLFQAGRAMFSLTEV